MRAQCLSVLLAVAVLPTSALAAASSFVQLVKEARQARETRDFARAEVRLRDALAQRPGHPAALYELAATHAARGAADRACETLGRLARMGLSIDPDPATFGALQSERCYERARGAFARNRQKRGEATQVFQVYIASYIPAGLAYDQDTGSYYISGAHERRIERVQRGRVSDFVAPGAGGLWAPLGLVADSRRRLLWVASAAIPQMKNAEADELGRTAVLAYDLDTGQFKRRLLLEEPGEHLLGDLALARKGHLYATDRRAGLLYEIDGTSGRFRALTQPGQLSSPQGVALSRDGDTVYVADYTQGLYRYDLGKNRLTRLDVADDVCIYGISGLYRHDDDLIAVQTGIHPHRVVRLELDRGGRRVARTEILAANLEAFAQPGGGVVIGDRFAFITNSQWHRFDAQHRLPPKEQLRAPLVVRVDVRAREPERPRDAFGEPAAAPGPGPQPGVTCALGLC